MNKKAKSETPKVFLTDRAASDLLEIESYSIKKWGKNIATKYLGKFERVFKLLALNPDLLLPKLALPCIAVWKNDYSENDEAQITDDNHPCHWCYPWSKMNCPLFHLLSRLTRYVGNVP